MSLDVTLSRRFRKSYEPFSVPFPFYEEGIETIYDSNITHNLTGMAEAAGIYRELWTPEELNITKAKQLIKPLEEGLSVLKKSPDLFKKFNAQNGWGTYENFVSFVERYLNACKVYPEADVTADR